MAKAEQAQALAAALMGILDLHRPEFPLSQRPVVPSSAAPDAVAISARHRKAALTGVGLFNRAGRAQAKAAAETAARNEIAAIIENDQRTQAAYQAELDRIWQRLLDNDPEIVLGTLAEAFEDNEAAAAPVGVVDAEVSVVVLVPTPDAVPERKPATTAAGNLTLKKLTKREHADFYKLMVCGYVLTTVRETFAVAPGLAHVRVVALRDSGPNAYGRPQVEAVLAARFARHALEGVRWESADAGLIVNDVSEQLTVAQLGPSKVLGPLSLAEHREIADLLEVVDVSELMA